MKGIVSDHDVEGHVELLVRILQGPEWADLWTELGLEVAYLEDMGLTVQTADDVLWHACQAREFVLLTANRNARGPTSLEMTIKQHSSLFSLPVLTLANPNRIQFDRAYAARVAERLLQYLLEIDSVRGTGRLYLP